MEEDGSARFIFLAETLPAARARAPHSSWPAALDLAMLHFRRTRTAPSPSSSISSKTIVSPF